MIRAAEAGEVLPAGKNSSFGIRISLLKSMSSAGSATASAASSVSPTHTGSAQPS
jgi:hypothetical protein